MKTFTKETAMPVSASTLYRWHMQPGAFDQLVPPDQKIEVLERPERLEAGAKLIMKIYLGPIGVRWVAHHRDFVQNRQFVDEQVRGPFAHWIHTHRFIPVDEHASILSDHIEYRLPGGKLGELLGGWAIEAMLERMFDYRHTQTRKMVTDETT